MKITTMCLTVGLAFCAAHAAADEAPVKNETNVERGAKLKSDYKVDDARIDGLREKKFNDSEIKKVLAIAEKMPGGITDANVDSVVGMRKDGMGWGQIAKKQGFSLGSVMGKGSDKAMKAEKPAKAEKAEKAEKAQRPEKVERAEKPEHGKR